METTITIEADELDLTVEKPWGSYTVLDTRRGRWVKKLNVNPLQSTSLQRHRKRDEVWLIDTGLAEVTIESPEDGHLIVLRLLEGESIRVPRDIKHRIRNPAELCELVVIEVAYGNPLEDDIERFEDEYDRV